MEQIGAGTNGGSRRKAAGRKDAAKQSAVMDVTKLREALPRLKKLLVTKDEAVEDYNNGVAKEAEKSGLLASTVNKVVKAWAGEDFEEERRKIEQLSLAFEEVAKVA